MVMKKLIVVFTLLIMLLSLTASFAGAFSSGHDQYRPFTTARGETVQVQYAAKGERTVSGSKQRMKVGL